MLESIKKLFAGGILHRYQADAVVLRHPFFTIAAGREKKTMRSVLVKVYTDEGLEVEKKIDANYREAPLEKILPTLDNRFVAKTIEAGTSGGKMVEIIEAASTRTLRECLDDKSLSGREMRRAFSEVCEGAAYLHSLGLVHRGLSPEAITVTQSGDAKIIDLSLVMHRSKTHVGGTMIGPVGYVAPEVIRRGAVDQRADVYALGVIAYEMITGTLPLPRATGYEGLVKMINGRPTTLIERDADVSRELDEVVMKAIAKLPEDRYESAQELAEAFAGAPLPERQREKRHAFAAA